MACHRSPPRHYLECAENNLLAEFMWASHQLWAGHGGPRRGPNMVVNADAWGLPIVSDRRALMGILYFGRLHHRCGKTGLGGTRCDLEANPVVVGRPKMSQCLVFDVVPKNSALPVLWTALCTGSTTPIKSQKKMKVERSHKTNEQKHRKKILNIDDKYSGHFRKCTPYVFAKVSSKII